MARLYSNENLPLEVVARLRALGHDVLTSLEAGNANTQIPDQAVLEFAVRNERALLTINRWDFVRLHTEYPNHFGIIVCSQDPDTSGQAERIHRIMEETADLRGQLLRVNRPPR